MLWRTFSDASLRLKYTELVVAVWPSGWWWWWWDVCSWCEGGGEARPYRETDCIPHSVVLTVSWDGRGSLLSLRCEHNLCLWQQWECLQLLPNQLQEQTLRPHQQLPTTGESQCGVQQYITYYDSAVPLSLGDSTFVCSLVPGYDRVIL